MHERVLSAARVGPDALDRAASLIDPSRLWDCAGKGKGFFFEKKEAKNFLNWAVLVSVALSLPESPLRADRAKCANHKRSHAGAICA
jgi:hypothetical protein